MHTKHVTLTHVKIGTNANSGFVCTLFLFEHELRIEGTSFVCIIIPGVNSLEINLKA